MPYKTMMLELLMQRQELRQRLHRERRMLTVLDCYASELKQRHESWVKELSRANPAIDPIQIMSMAMELAVQDVEVHLHSAFPPEEMEAETVA